MSGNEFVYLVYHELGVAGQSPQGSDNGYLRYVVSTTTFIEQMQQLREGGWLGCTLTEALHSKRPVVALSFDDGTLTDLNVAAPALWDAGFAASFYIVAGWVGKPGHLRPSDLRRLVSLGHEIGSHSLTHPCLPTLKPEHLRRELQESKQRLEEWTGTPVLHFSCPLGAYSSRLIAEAGEAGYMTVSTSDVGTNDWAATLLKRVPIRSGTSASEFGDICEGKFRGVRARQVVLSALKSVIGFSAYSALCRVAPYRSQRHLVL